MQSSLKKQAAMLTAANAITRGMGFCLHLMLARNMGAEALGVMEMANTVSMLALTPVVAGIPTAMSRMTAQHPASDRENVLRAGKSYVRRASLALIPLLLLFSPLLAWLLGDQRTLPAIIVSAPALLPLGLCGVYSGYCVGMQRPHLPAINECAEQAVRFALAAALLLCLPRVSVAQTASLPLLAEMLAAMTVMLLYRRTVRIPRRLDQPSPALRRQIFRLSMPMMLSRLCATGMHALNAVLLPLCLQRSGLSQSAATAQFGMLHGMAMPLMLLPGIVTNALCTVSTPAVARLEHSGCGLKRLMHRLYLSAAAIGLVSCVGLFLGGGVVGVYLYKQVALTPLLRVLCPITLVISLRQVQFGMVAGLGLQGRALPGTLLSSAVTLLATAWLAPIPWLRLYGAAIGSILGQLTGLIWNTVLLHRRIKSVCARSAEAA